MWLILKFSTILHDVLNNDNIMKLIDSDRVFHSIPILTLALPINAHVIFAISSFFEPNYKSEKREHNTRLKYERCEWKSLNP